MPSASAAEDLGSTSTPVVSSTTSGVPPTRVTTLGTPLAIASSRTQPWVSHRLGGRTRRPHASSLRLRALQATREPDIRCNSEIVRLLLQMIAQRPSPTMSSVIVSPLSRSLFIASSKYRWPLTSTRFPTLSRRVTDDSRCSKGRKARVSTGLDTTHTGVVPANGAMRCANERWPRRRHLLVETLGEHSPTRLLKAPRARGAGVLGHHQWRSHQRRSQRSGPIRDELVCVNDVCVPALALQPTHGDQNAAELLDHRDLGHGGMTKSNPECSNPALDDIRHLDGAAQPCV